MSTSHSSSMSDAAAPVPSAWPFGPLLGFDTETTGVESPEAAAAVHGVTTERARAEGRPVTEVLAEVSEHLVEAMAAGTPVVAFNASYDLTLMEAELARHGLPTMRSRLGRELGPIADPLVLDRAVDR